MTSEDVLGYVEAVLVALWDEGGHRIARPFPRLTWRDAMERYGTDKPDLRYDLAIADWTSAVRPLASFACRSAPCSARSFTNGVKPCSAAPCSAAWCGRADGLGT